MEFVASMATSVFEKKVERLLYAILLACIAMLVLLTK